MYSPFDLTNDIETIFLHHPPVDVVEPLTGHEYSAMSLTAIEPLVDVFTKAIANTIQLYINAGSERDVTNEDEILREGLLHALREWLPEEA